MGALSIYAQPFTAGVKLGVPANQFVSTVQSPGIDFRSYTNRYIVGGTAELRLPFGLGVEVDALYRHYNFETSGALSPAGTTLTASGSTGAWEFPLLAKYRFPFKLARPFVDAGAAWDTLQGLKQAITVVSPVPIVPPKNFNHPVHGTTTGFVLGGGVEIRVPYVHISPEIRFTHWVTQHFVTASAPPLFSANSGFSSNQNQVEALLGITF